MIDRFVRPESSESEVIRAVIEQRIWWSDFLAQEFNGHGWDAVCYFPTVKACRRTVLGADGVRKQANDRDDREDKRKYVEQIILRDRPDCVFFHEDSMVLDSELHNRIRKSCKTVKIIAGYYGTASRNVASRVRGLDLLFVPCNWMVDKYKAAGVRTEKVTYGFPVQLCSEFDVANRPRAISAAMVGNLGIGVDAWATRYKLASRIVDVEGVELFGGWGFKSRSHKRTAVLAYLASRIAKRLQIPKRMRENLPLIHWAESWSVPPWLLLENDKMFLSKIQPGVYGRKFWELLFSAQVMINCHSDLAKGESVNFRLFEATGAGCCLLTNYSEDLGRLFELDTEVVCYKTIDEAVEKLNYLISNPKVAAEIANKGRDRTLREHSFSRRASQIESAIRKLLH